MPTQREIGFTPEQIRLLQEIRQKARQMEHIKNDGKVHAVIALIEELSNSYIDIIYFLEKANLLFMPEYEITAKEKEP
jgi:predicted nucleotidyltransferase